MIENKENELNKYDNLHLRCGPNYRDNQLQQALQKMKNMEITAIYHLTESHVPGLREKAIYRHDKHLSSNKSINSIGKKYIEFHCSVTSISDKVQCMLKSVEELPKEWTIIQITSKYNFMESINRNVNRHFTNPLHISMFNCGQIEEMPICVTTCLPFSDVGNTNIEIMMELEKIINENNTLLKEVGIKPSKSQRQRKEEYIDLKCKIGCRLENLVRSIENSWIREWKCLFVGKYQDVNLENEVRRELEEILKENELLSITFKNKIILYYLIKGYHFMTVKDVKHILKFVVPDDITARVNIYRKVQTISERLNLLYAKTHPILLILDEKLDCVPWECTNMLENQAVSRMPSLHFAYGLFKEHESSIINGFKVVSNPFQGNFIINPDLDLKGMEKRMSTFFKYWIPNWNGLEGAIPTPVEFEEAITKSDIFSYSGHGSGVQFLSGEKIECLKIKAVVLLFGCGSVALTALGPTAEKISTHYTYLIACSPCVLGMLYNVSDFDTDCITTSLLSEFIPSEADVHWRDVDKIKWYKENRIVRNDVETFKFSDSKRNEPDLLRAIILAKKQAKSYITRAACVCRGLPVRIEISNV